MRLVGVVACVALAACAPSLVWTGRGPDRGVAVTVVRDGARLAITSGGTTRAYDAIAFERLVWTPRGALVPAQRDGVWWIVDGADERGPFVSVGEIVRAGAHVAYVSEGADGVRVTVDGSTGSAYDAVGEGLQLDADAGSVAYVVRRSDGEHAVHDGDVGPAAELVAMLRLGAKGRSFAWVERGTRDRLFVDDHEIATYDAVLELVIAADEPHWAALVTAGDDTALVHDGATLSRATYLSHLRISDDGAHVACLAPLADGSAIDVVVDGAHVAHHRRIEGERLAFVPGDARVVFAAEDVQGLRMTLGEVVGERYESIEGPVLAPHRAGWIGQRGGHSEVVIDGAVVASEPWAGTLALAAHGDGYAYVARSAGGQRFVVTSRGRWPVPRLFVDTLVLDDDGLHWAALVPDVAAHRLEVWIDGAPHGALDELELGGAVAIQTERSLPEIVREIALGELARHRR